MSSRPIRQVILPVIRSRPASLVFTGRRWAGGTIFGVWLLWACLGGPVEGSGFAGAWPSLSVVTSTNHPTALLRARGPSHSACRLEISTNLVEWNSALNLRLNSTGGLDVPWNLRAGSAAWFRVQTQTAPPAPELYDLDVLRVFYLQFSQADWAGQLASGYHTESNVLADLTVDGITYPRVGVQYRGNVSYLMATNSPKKSFALTLDAAAPGQRLWGYKSLNLNNSINDGTFLREVLYTGVCRNFLPSPKANFVQLIINGRNFGIYINVQQENEDLLQDWFDEPEGDRWRAGASQDRTMPALEWEQVWAPGQIWGWIPSAVWGWVPPYLDGAGRIQVQGWVPGWIPGLIPGWVQVWAPKAPTPPDSSICFGSDLSWQGEDATNYFAAYELKSNPCADAWTNLVEVIGLLNHTPAADMENRLESRMAVDRFLWMLALENVFLDTDGYLAKAGDYGLFFDRKGGRLHPIQRDGNATFVTNGLFADGTHTSPFYGESHSGRALATRIFSVPHYRQRYLAHLRLLLDQYFRWEYLAPHITTYGALIETEVLADTLKITRNDEFLAAVHGNQGPLKSFVDDRRSFLLSHPEINRPGPIIASVYRGLGATNCPSPAADQPALISARVRKEPSVASVSLYYRVRPDAAFVSVAMFDDGAHQDEEAGDGVFAGQIPGQPGGTAVNYYVCAQAADPAGTLTFAPAAAEAEHFTYQVQMLNRSSPVVINEVVADNQQTQADEHGNYGDWIELHNVTRQPVDMSGKYLSDNAASPRLWRFPPGVTLEPGGFIIVWADGRSSDRCGLHTNFKLSAQGETLLLVDRDDLGNTPLDGVTFKALATNIAWARTPDGAGDFCWSLPSPGRSNHAP